jgi:hypothetical protein
MDAVFGLLWKLNRLTEGFDPGEFGRSYSHRGFSPVGLSDGWRRNRLNGFQLNWVE